MCNRFWSLIFPLRGCGTWVLSSECNLNKLVLRVECPFHNLSPKRTSALIHKPSAQISKAFNQHGTAGKTKY